MHPSVILLSIIAAAGPSIASPALSRAPCNADNCARAVTGTRGGSQASRLADCASFFSVTVQPPPVTSVITVTPTYDTSGFMSGSASPYTDTQSYTYTTEIGLKKRFSSEQGPVTIRPTAVPAYASACSGAQRFSSACACGGATAVTTTVPASTTYFTYTSYPFVPCYPGTDGGGPGVTSLACTAPPSSQPIPTATPDPEPGCASCTVSPPTTVSTPYPVITRFPGTDGGECVSCTIDPNTVSTYPVVSTFPAPGTGCVSCTIAPTSAGTPAYPGPDGGSSGSGSVPGYEGSGDYSNF